MRHLCPLILIASLVAAMWFFPSCVTPPVEPRVHSIQTVTTICAGPLCSICDESEESSR